jgi:hypothetical protein
MEDAFHPKAELANGGHVASFGIQTETADGLIVAVSKYSIVDNDKSGSTQEFVQRLGISGGNPEPELSSASVIRVLRQLLQN